MKVKWNLHVKRQNAARYQVLETYTMRDIADLYNMRCKLLALFAGFSEASGLVTITKRTFSLI